MKLDELSRSAENNKESTLLFSWGTSHIFPPSCFWLQRWYEMGISGDQWTGSEVSLKSFYLANPCKFYIVFHKWSVFLFNNKTISHFLPYIRIPLKLRKAHCVCRVASGHPSHPVHWCPVLGYTALGGVWRKHCVTSLSMMEATVVMTLGLLLNLKGMFTNCVNYTDPSQPRFAHF